MDVANQGGADLIRHERRAAHQQLKALGVSDLNAQDGAPLARAAVAPFEGGAAFSLQFDRKVSLSQAAAGLTVFLAPAKGLVLEMDGQAEAPVLTSKGVIYADGDARLTADAGVQVLGFVVATDALKEHLTAWFPERRLRLPEGHVAPCGPGRAEALVRFLEFLVMAAGDAEDSLGEVSRDRCRATLLDLLAESLAEQAPDVRWTVSPGHLRRAEAYVLANLSKEITAAEVAAAAGVSARSLYRAFQEFRGLTFGQFVRNARMDAARELLRRRAELPLRSVAQRVGYSDYTSFWRHFRARFGVSPRVEGERIAA